MTLAELEARFTGPVGAMPRGVHRGRFLGFLDTPGARAPFTRAVDTLLFVWPRWGLDFDRRLWWFGRPALAAGRFVATPGRSRWRDTEVLRLTYERSHLPSPIRGVLYDEVKPLPDGEILGLGGVNAERGRGDHFFFELATVGP